VPANYLWIATPGTFIYEPAGEAHTLVITNDSPEPARILFTRKYYREAGRLDVGQLDLLIR
jgi:quercetin dioxygenase-like cupin family protein